MVHYIIGAYLNISEAQIARITIRGIKGELYLKPQLSMFCVLS